MNKNSNLGWKIAIVGLIIIIIIVFVLSFGKWGFEKNNTIPDEFSDSKEEARRKHREITEQLSRDEALNNKLIKIYKRMYFSIRVVFVLLWASILFFLHTIHWVQNLGDILNYSEAMILICLVLNFLSFGTIANLKDFSISIRIKLENWIWRNNRDLESKIKNNKIAIKQTESSI